MDYETKYWVKKALSAQRSLKDDVDDINSDIDDMIYDEENTYKAMQSIIVLMERKRRLLALRTIVTETLSEITPKYRELLAGRYLHFKTCDAVADGLCIWKRQFFRDHDAAVRECAAYLDKRGCTAKWFARYYGDILDDVRCKM